jgi:predicted porin
VGERPHNTAYGLNLGAEAGRLSADVVYQHYNQAISVLNPLLGATSTTQGFQAATNSINTIPITGANVVDPANTLYGIVTDNTAVLVALKYNLEPFRLYAGYEHIRQQNPSEPLGIGASDEGGYILSGVEDNNLTATKIVQIWWVGVKYALDAKTDVTVSYYEQDQNDFRVPPACAPAASEVPSCAGTLYEASIYADHHITKRFDVYAGIAYSHVSGGLAIAIPHSSVPYFYDSNVAPSAGFRFAF